MIWEPQNAEHTRHEGYPMTDLFPALTQFMDSFYVFGGDFISLTINIVL
ncbi:UNVERIFIED_CONTAM: hypothetical protein DES50_104197 [Williamsia faeni]